MFFLPCLGSLSYRLTPLQPILLAWWPDFPETLYILDSSAPESQCTFFIYSPGSQFSRHSLLLHHRARSPPCFLHTSSQLPASAWSCCTSPSILSKLHDTSLSLQHPLNSSHIHDGIHPTTTTLLNTPITLRASSQTPGSSVVSLSICHPLRQQDQMALGSTSL